MSKTRAPVSTIDPHTFRAGVEWIKSRQVLAPADGSLVHAEWSSWTRPPFRPYATTSSEVHSAWCGVRLRLILTEMFDPKSAAACPDCLKAFQRGYPAAMTPQ